MLYNEKKTIIKQAEEDTERGRYGKGKFEGGACFCQHWFGCSVT